MVIPQVPRRACASVAGALLAALLASCASPAGSRPVATTARPPISAEPIFTAALHEWGGQPCAAAAMRSQLPPPSNPPAEVICLGPVQPA
jgi:hypothetical protein